MQQKRDCPKIKYDEEQVILPILVNPSSPVDISSPLLPPHYFYPPSPYLSFLSQLYYRNRGLLPGKYNELPYSSLSKDEPAHSYVAHRLVHQEEGKLKAIKNPTSSTLMTSTDICPRRFIDTHTFQLVEFGENSVIPPYAILSHTWTKGEEIVYEEFTHPRGETFPKQGYRKILAACQQAHQDGIHYIWADTCCIKQGNHADVAVNIMSMYAYYQNAEVCYAYLADVVHDAVMSLWLKRGWTLQELLAPRTVVFFNKDWRRIGDKHQLRYALHQRTTIPHTVLSGEQSIQNVSVLTRMSWVVGRRTTKEQDGAYCLQGLLGVAVEPDYDEYWATSFNRLGKALLAAQPELEERLGIKHDLFSDPDNLTLHRMLVKRFWTDHSR